MWALMGGEKHLNKFIVLATEIYGSHNKVNLVLDQRSSMGFWNSLWLTAIIFDRKRVVTFHSWAQIIPFKSRTNFW